MIKLHRFPKEVSIQKKWILITKTESLFCTICKRGIFHVYYNTNVCFVYIPICLISAATYFLLATKLGEKIEIVNVEDVFSYTDGPMLP